MGRAKLFLLLLIGQVVCGEESFQLDEICPPDAVDLVDCNEVVTIPCAGDRNGSIYSPGYSADPSGHYSQEEHKGSYKIVFKTSEDCGKVSFEVVFTEDDFHLMQNEDKLSMGNGLEVGQGAFLSFSGNGGGNVLSAPEVVKTTKDDQFWLDLYVGTKRGVSFVIRYTIVDKRLDETTVTDRQGNLTSPGYFANQTYPDRYEQHIVIDVAEDAAKEQQLLLTVNEFDLAGTFGDYLLIGSGTEVFKDPYAVLLSWKIPNKRQFIIDGTKAHLVFQSFDRAGVNTNDTFRGFWISYKAIDTMVTPPPPVTTAAPTTPVPDYRSNSSILLDLGNRNEDWFNSATHEIAKQSFRERLATVCNEYKPALDNKVAREDVKILSIEPCYDGWYEDITRCMQIRAAVIELDADAISIFPPSVLEEAVRLHGRPHDIALPTQMTDVYLYAILAAVGIILIVALLLVALWRVKLQEYYKQQQDSFKIQSAKMEDELDRRNSSIKPLGALNSRMNPWKRGVENPNFVFDEDTGETALEYDPETGAAYPTSVFSWMNQPSSNFTKTPWLDEVNDSDTEIYSHATAPSVVSSSASVVSKTVSSSAGSNPKRSILKKTNSGGTAYDMIPPPTYDRVDKFVDVPLTEPKNRHVYDVPAAPVQVLDADGRGSIGETYL